MIPKGQRRYFIIGSLGAFLFCMSLCALVRSCELREIRSAIRRSHAYAVPDSR